jgi:23S rRNA (uridine2552-2'-O)-methyltransferase
MRNNDWVHNHHTKKARDSGLVARSYYKLEEIDKKYQICQWEKNMVALDLGCAPWSWIQYLATCENIDKVVWFDLKKSKIEYPQVSVYEQDLTERDVVQGILDEEWIQPWWVDLIVSDMAPDTIGMKDIDALRSVWLIEKTLWIYEKYLHPEHGVFAIKVFMGPGYDELVNELRDIYGRWNIVIFKPKCCRKKSKETFIVKRIKRKH